MGRATKRGGATGRARKAPSPAQLLAPLACDPDQLDALIDGAPDDLMVMSRAQMRTISGEVRLGNAARLAFGRLELSSTAHDAGHRAGIGG